MRGGSWSTIVLDRAMAYGKVGGIELGSSTDVTLTGGAELRGDELALRFGSASTLHVTSSQLTSKQVALRGELVQGLLHRRDGHRSEQAVELGSSLQVHATRSTVTVS